jgi:hypothetical protein
MKKNILSVLAFMCLFSSVWAQQTITCKPDATLPDTSRGVFPVPYTKENPKGGISDTACLNTFYDFVFTMIIPKQFTLAGLTVPINSVDIATSRAIENLPTGLNYTCNPPNCVFKAEEKGCIIISGTPTNASNIGQNDLKIKGVLRTGLLPLDVNFPNEQIAPGNYYLYLRPQGSKACLTSSTRELAATKLRMGNVPNPFTGFTQIEVEAELRGQFEFRVYDLVGRILQRRPVQITQGINRIPFEAYNLTPGLYVFTLTDGINTVSRKMVIGR